MSQSRRAPAVRRRLPQIARALDRRDDHGACPVGLDAAVEQAQRLRHPARGVVVGETHRRAHHGRGVAGGVTADRHSHLAEVVFGRAVVVHVTPRDEGHLLNRRLDAEGHRVLIAAAEPLTHLLPRSSPLRRRRPV
jgi:hypothetical protein